MGGVPSLVKCKRLTINSDICMNRSTQFVGNVSITNKSDESKFVTGKIEDTDLDVSDALGLGVLKPTVVKSSPISGQEPGTSAIRRPRSFCQRTLNNLIMQCRHRNRTVLFA